MYRALYINENIQTCYWMCCMLLPCLLVRREDCHIPLYIGFSWQGCGSGGLQGGLWGKAGAALCQTQPTQAVTGEPLSWAGGTSVIAPCTPRKGSRLEQFFKNCSPWQGPPHWSRGTVWGRNSSEQMFCTDPSPPSPAPATHPREGRGRRGRSKGEARKTKGKERWV